jgi:hypothetical protein
MVSKTVLYVSGAAAFVVAGSVFFTLGKKDLKSCFKEN